MPTKKHGMWGSKTYKTWIQMKQRCTNPKSTSYPYYGGVGISFDPSWKEFQSFIGDMGIRPEGMTLDRIDNTKSYSKDNCRWQTPKEQANNRTNNIFVELEDNLFSPLELSHIWGKSLHGTYNRITSFFKLDLNKGVYIQDRPIISRNRK